MPEKLEIHIILTISKILKDLVFTKCTFLELDWSFEIYQKPLNFFEKKIKGNEEKVLLSKVKRVHSIIKFRIHSNSLVRPNQTQLVIIVKTVCYRVLTAVISST